MIQRLPIILLLFMTLGSVAQDSIDSMAVPAKPAAGVISNFVFQFDNRTERYYDVRGRMNGLKIGVEFYKRVRIGFGGYSSNDFYRIPYDEVDDSITRTARFAYTTIFTEFVVFRNFHWEISVIGASGRGNMAINVFNTQGTFPTFIRQDSIQNIKVRDFSVNGLYKIFPWFGVGLGLGYRNVIDVGDVNLRKAFQDPYLDFKLKVYLSYAYRAIFKPEVIQMERVYYDYRKAKRHAYVKSRLGL